MKRLLTVFCLSALLASPAAADSYIGYTNTEFDRTGGVRFGNSETQGQAIKLPKEKLDLLRGKQIKGVRAVFGTRNMETLTFFVTTDLNAAPLYTQEADGGTASWRDFDFDTPYTIGDEDVLYVGYTLTALTAYRPLQFDNSMELADRSFYYDGSGWNDAYGQNIGCACLQLIVDDADFTDITVKNFSANGYYLAGHPYKYTGQVLNFGTETINSFDVVFRMGNGDEQTCPYTDVNLGSNETFDIEFPEYVSSESGELPIEVSVANINGQDADADASDNAVTADIYMYPSDMKRAVLLEDFTGQSCSNCPTGHRAINSALEEFNACDVVEIFHHIGYQPDNFTMAEELFYINFNSGGGRYAPAFMVNRMAGESSSSPVQNVSTGAVLNMLNAASAIQPYVDVQIASNYDEATRRVSGNVNVFTHVMPESDNTLLGLFIVQDSIIATQLGASDSYVHRYVYRGSLFGDYGSIIHLEKGNTVSVPFEYELPDEIVSTYFEGQPGYDELPSVPTDPDNMYLIAVVSQYSTDNDYSEYQVYNVCSVKMCADNGATGISATEAVAAGPRVRVSGGVVSVPSSCGRVEVYDMSGRVVRSSAGASSFSLPRGMYIVRGWQGGTSFTDKIVISE